MDQEEKERELMNETLNKIDEVSKGKKNTEKRFGDWYNGSLYEDFFRSELLFDSSITLKDIFGQSAKSDDVVFNASIRFDSGHSSTFGPCNNRFEFGGGNNCLRGIAGPDKEPD